MHGHSPVLCLCPALGQLATGQAWSVIDWVSMPHGQCEFNGCGGILCDWQIYFGITEKLCHTARAKWGCGLFFVWGFLLLVHS